MSKSATGAVTLIALFLACPMLAQEGKAVRDSFTASMTGTVLLAYPGVPPALPGWQ